MKVNKFLPIIAILIVAAFALPALATFDVVKLQISNVTTSLTADADASTTVGEIKRISVVSETSAGVDWRVKSTADGTILLSGTNLSATAVTVTNLSLPAVGITLEAFEADSADKDISATITLDK